jgi:protein RecA
MNEKEKKTYDETLKTVLGDIEHSFGRGSVMVLGDRPNVSVDALSSGSILLDECLGVGGYPKGRIVEIYGPESSGKTTLALTAIAETQKNGGKCAFIDAEQSIDPTYAKNLGVNIDELILSQPDSGEQALQIVEMLAKSGIFSLIVVDSVAALVPQAEVDGLMEDSSIGLLARLMSKALRKIAAVLNKGNCTVIFINQLREKVGVIYGNPEITTGGRALKFYASVRLDIRRIDAIKEGVNVVGNTVNVKIVKNKVAPPFKSCKLDIIYGQGVSKEGEVLDLGLQMGIIKKAGSWYEIDGERMGQGRDTAKMYLHENKDLFEKVKKEILNGEKTNRKINNNEKIDENGVISPNKD